MRWSIRISDELDCSGGDPYIDPIWAKDEETQKMKKGDGGGFKADGSVPGTS